MKKILLLVLAATLVCSASLFTACSVANDDNAAGVTPVQSRVGYSAWHTQCAIEQISDKGKKRDGKSIPSAKCNKFHKKQYLCNC